MTQRLPLENLAERHVGLTRTLAETYLEAARVCFDRHHTSPQLFILKQPDLEQKIKVEWVATDERTKRAWNNRDDATRDGAYAVALATCDLVLALFAVRRAETLTGADYYIAPANQAEDDLEGWSRLEVSGTDGNISEVNRRLKIKLKQAQEGNNNLPALAIVVGFQVKLIAMQKVEELP